MKFTLRILLFSVLALIIFGFTANHAFAQNESAGPAVTQDTSPTAVKAKMNALLLYHTKTGHTLEAANAIVKGIQSAGGSVMLVLAKDFTPQTINQYDVLIVGSPCWGGSIASGVSTPISDAMKTITNEVKGKLCAGFSVNASFGAKSTVKSIGERLKEKGCTEYVEGPVAKAGAPLSMWVGPTVKPEDLDRYRAFGEDLVKKFTGQKK
jgi:flavodoxin